VLNIYRQTILHNAAAVNRLLFHIWYNW